MIPLDATLSTAGMLLDRAEIVLRQGTDEEAGDLAHEVRNLQQHLLFIRKPEHQTADRIAGLSHKVATLSARVRDWAERNRVRFVTLDTPASESTQRMTSDEIKTALEAMPKRASVPPPAVLDEVLEAQRLSLADFRDRDTLPAIEETTPALPVTEEEES